MDNFAEQLVRKESTGTDKIKNIMYLFSGIAVTLILAALGIIFLGKGIITFLFLAAAAAAGYATFFIMRNTKVEYEYTFTNGDLDIDKIIAQTKRKEMLTIQVSKFTNFGKYNDNTPEETADMTVIMATDNIASHEYYADFPHEEYGSARLVFSPNEKMLSNIKRSLHPSIRNKVSQELQNSFISNLGGDL